MGEDWVEGYVEGSVAGRSVLPVSALLKPNHAWFTDRYKAGPIRSHISDVNTLSHSSSSAATAHDTLYRYIPVP